MSKNTSKLVATTAKTKPATHTTTPTDTDTRVTDSARKERFEAAEQQIDKSRNNVFELAAALAIVRADELYKPDYKTFEEYCRKRWEYGRSYCSRLCDMDSVMADLKQLPDATDVLPRNESQARVFVDLEKAERTRLFEKILEEKGDAALTATLFKKHKKAMFPEKCVVKPKKKTSALVIDDEGPGVLTDKIGFNRLFETADKLFIEVQGEPRASDLHELLGQFLVLARPWAEREQQSKEEQN